MHRRIFAERWSCSSPQSRREWETQKFPPGRKGGSSILYSGLHEKPSPKGLPKPPGAMVGQFGKRGRFFSRRGLTLPLCTGVFSQRGGPVLLPNPAGNGKHKSSHREKKWEQCYIFRISWKFKPQGLSQTARGNGGTIRRAQEIFLPARGDSPVMHRRIFTEGWSCSSPQSRREWETQKLPPKKKGGSSVYKSRTNR